MSQYPMQYEKPVNVQPQGVPGMSIGGNRNTKNMPMNKDGRSWSNGLCACTDCGMCCLGHFCPCIAYTYTKRRLEWLNTKGAPDPEHGGSCCTGDCMLYMCLNAVVGAGCVLQISERSNIRQRYSIEGGCCGDCMATWCCTGCQFSQASAELELEEQSLMNAQAGYGR